MANNISSSSISSNNGQKTSTTALPPNHHKIWVTDDSICYLVGGKKATVRGRSEAELQKLDSGSSCLICSSDTNDHHYGARSCKNCGDFFKRSVLGCLEYICTMGGRCRLVGENLDQSCSACRLRKCVFNGMSIERVRQEKSEEEARRVLVTAAALPKSAPTTSVAVVEKRPSEAVNATLMSASTIALVEQVRSRIVTANRDAVFTATSARDNVAHDVQLFVNSVLCVGKDLVNQIDAYMTHYLEVNRERLKELDELQKAVKSSPNSIEASKKLSTFLKENSFLQSINIKYNLSKSVKDRSTVAKLFNEPLVDESPLPAVMPTPDEVVLPIVSTLPATDASTSEAVAKSNVDQPRSSSRAVDSDLASSAYSVDQPTDSAVDLPSSSAANDNLDEVNENAVAEKAARKAAKRAAAAAQSAVNSGGEDDALATVSGGGPTSAKRKPSLQIESTTARDEPFEVVAPRKSKPVRKIDSSDSEACASQLLPPPAVDEKRIRMEKSLRKLERRRAVEAHRQQLKQQLQQSKKEAPRGGPPASNDKPSKQKNKSEKKKQKEKKRAEKAKNAENRKENLKPSSPADKTEKLKERVSHVLSGGSGDNRASSSSHPSLKKRKQKRANKRNPEDLFSNHEKLLLKENDFKLVSVSISAQEMSTFIGRFISKVTADANKVGAIIHNFIPNDRNTSAAEARALPRGSTSSPVRGRKAISEQPLLSAAGDWCDKATFV